MHPMCSQCNKKPATIKLTRIIDGEVTELTLCKDCAAEISPYQKKLQTNLSEILQKLIGGSGAQKPEEEKTQEKQKIKIKCSRCGLSYDTYKSSLFLGCNECYESFDKYITSDLRRIHGSTTHIGKMPPGYRARFEKHRTLTDLQKALEQSIADEDFEKAIELRDKIRILKEEK